MSIHKSPTDGDVGAVALGCEPPVGSNAVPSYTFNCPVDVSNQSSPFKGAVGADVDAEFYNNFTRSSFNNSPKPE